jgi:Zn finger protein HypA/HybF involved in hydrogenase expression
MSSANPTEVTAREKFPCPACGAQAEWNPAKQKLICPFCGTESPYQINRTTGAIEEIDLVKTLRELPEELRGWQAPRRSVRCQSCRAVMVFDAARVGQNCEFCGSPALIAYDEIKEPIRPQSLLPFKIPETAVREQIRRWYAGKWFAPGALKSRALVDTVHGVYLPYWTFDAQASCPWRAEAGYYYYTTETYRDNQGRTQTRQVRNVRWAPASGRVDHFFDDEPVAGSQGVRLDLLKKIEPFPTGDLVPYDAAMLSGFVVEHYQVVLLDAAQRSIDQMTAQLRRLCAEAVPGDTYRSLEVFPEFSDRTFKHILVPVWLLTYTYGAKSYQVLVNGYTGKMDGSYPVSPWKVLLAITIAIIVLIVFLYVAGQS